MKRHFELIDAVQMYFLKENISDLGSMDFRASQDVGLALWGGNLLGTANQSDDTNKHFQSMGKHSLQGNVEVVAARS